MIDVSKIYDGQGALKNGIHDAIRLPNEPCLYREGVKNQMLWHLGRFLGALPGARYVVRTDAPRRNVKETSE